ncbi:AAA family ATPase [Streptomyces sp. NPDC030920]|uniref:AAA family ATPase n=1 Tax=Streptomyces sp. NPDC030920 TaxID=3365308 RepID=UPI00384FEBB7
MGAGGPALVDVTGEAGIGKSRLLAEFSTLARRRGAAVLRGRATEFERHSPFQPFADAFADLDQRVLGVFPSLRELLPVLRGRTEPSGEPWNRDRFGSTGPPRTHCAASGARGSSWSSTTCTGRTRRPWNSSTTSCGTL